MVINSLNFTELLIGSKYYHSGWKFSLLKPDIFACFVHSGVGG